MGDFDFTEEEIRNELKKFGYTNVPFQKIVQFKRDLESMVNRQSDVAVRNSGKFQNPRILDQDVLSGNNIYKESLKTNGIIKREALLKTNGNFIPSLPARNESGETESVSDASECSYCRGVKLIKRKTHTKAMNDLQEDESSISETFSQLDVTDLYSPRDEKYPRSLSVGIVPSRSSVILTTSTDLRPNKCDPVKKYHEYKKYWNENIIPGEEAHRQLRWGVRERMCQFNPGLYKNIRTQKRRMTEY